jgi:hypothetical protein
MYICRYYYNTRILLPVAGRRLVYMFGPNAIGWREGLTLIVPPECLATVTSQFQHSQVKIIAQLPHIEPTNINVGASKRKKKPVKTATIDLNLTIE